MSTAVPIRRPRRTLLLVLVLVFFAPLGLSFLIYYGSGWRPPGHTNHGALIEPPRLLPQVAGADVLSRKWSLVYIGAGDCDPRCRKALYFMRQTHWSLGNLSARVQRVFLVSARCCDRDFLEREHPDLITLNAQAETLARLLSVFPPDQRASTIFVVDPRGNLMMRYDANADPKGLREDLKKLLNLSHIG